jgi:hypothetical protein
MEKAYDPKALLAKLKGRGLDIAEESAKILVEESFSWLEESAKLSASPIDDVASVVYPHAKKFALDQIDKIDGVIGA